MHSDSEQRWLHVLLRVPRWLCDKNVQLSSSSVANSVTSAAWRYYNRLSAAGQKQPARGAAP